MDIEKIREDALSEVTKNYQGNAYGNSLKLYADISSQITKLMLEKYHEQLHKVD